jgi:hypothetical protein
MATWTKEKRVALPLTDFGQPSGRVFPIKDQEDLDEAFRLLQSARNPAPILARLLAIAKRKRLTVPDHLRDLTAAAAKFAAVEIAADRAGLRDRAGLEAMFSEAALADHVEGVTFAAGEAPAGSCTDTLRSLCAGLPSRAPEKPSRERIDQLLSMLPEGRALLRRRPG